MKNPILALLTALVSLTACTQDTEKKRKTFSSLSCDFECFQITRFSSLTISNFANGLTYMEEVAAPAFKWDKPVCPMAYPAQWNITRSTAR